MAVQQMSKLAICAMKEKRKAVLEAIQSMGVMQIIDYVDVPDDGDGHGKGTVRMDTLQSRMTFDRYAQLASDALEILNKYSPEKKGLLASFEGKPLEEASEEKRMERERDALNAKANRIVSLEREIAAATAEIAKCRSRIETLIPWQSLDVPINTKGTKLTSALIGMMPGTLDEAAIRVMIAEKEPDIDALDVRIVNNEKGMSTYLVVLCMKEDAQKVEDILRENGFARPQMTESAIPAVQMTRLSEKIKETEKLIEQKKKLIASFAPYRRDLMILSDYYRIRSQKYDVLGQIPQTNTAFFIEGYVPAKYADRMVKLLEEEYGAFVEVEEIGEDEDVPVLLQNNSFASMVEGTTASFGLPSKGEIDPTSIMSIFFIFFFGLMLSDAAYGLILSLATGILLLKCPRMENGMKNLLKIFFWGGLSTLFWGVLFGGYFGDVITVVSKVFFDKEVTVPALWFVPLNNPMKLLIWSMIFGIVHLFTGLGIKGYMLIRDKDWTSFIFDVLCWYLLLIGLLLMLIPTKIFAGIAGQQIVFPAWLNLAAKLMAAAGAVGILIMSARDKKNFGLRIALGLYDLYGISGWLSDVLSYSRLLALGLATGVIASVINQMGTMFGGGVVGAILFIIIFILGHLLNIAINLLGAYVHTCRLQYVEFFGKFYNGGGSAFTPFGAKTKYVDFKEEN